MYMLIIAPRQLHRQSGLCRSNAAPSVHFNNQEAMEQLQAASVHGRYKEDSSRPRPKTVSVHQIVEVILLVFVDLGMGSIVLLVLLQEVISNWRSTVI